MMETNRYLQQRILDAAERARNIRGSLTSLENGLDRLVTIAQFRDEDEEAV